MSPQQLEERRGPTGFFVGVHSNSLKTKVLILLKLAKTFSVCADSRELSCWFLAKLVADENLCRQGKDSEQPRGEIDCRARKARASAKPRFAV